MERELGSLSPSTLYDITDSIALTNGHLDGGLTDHATDQELNCLVSWSDFQSAYSRKHVAQSNKSTKLFHIQETFLHCRRRRPIDCLNIIVKCMHCNLDFKLLQEIINAFF